jgi:hypothetical protein
MPATEQTLYFKFVTSLVPTERDQAGCDGFYIKSAEHIPDPFKAKVCDGCRFAIHGTPRMVHIQYCWVCDRLKRPDNYLPPPPETAPECSENRLKTKET